MRTNSHHTLTRTHTFAPASVYSKASKRTRKIKSLALVTLFLLWVALSAQAGTHTWTGGSTSGLWSTAANWQNNEPPVLGESPLHLIFPTNAPRRMATNNIANVVINSITFQGAAYTLAGISAGTNVTIDSSQNDSWWNIRAVSGVGHTIHYSMNFALAGTLECYIATNASITVRSALRHATPNSGLFKEGPGTLILDPIEDNTFDGGTLVNDGLLSLQGSHVNFGFQVSDITVPGPLVVGNNSSTAAQPRCHVDFSHQIADNADVTVRRNGKLFFAGASDTIGSLTLVGGSVETSNATVALNGNVLAQDSGNAQPSQIQGRLSLGNLSRHFNVVSNAVLDVSAVIAGGISSNVPAGIIKEGLGQMNFTSASNTFGGLLDIRVGALSFTHSRQLGAPTNGTSVASNAVLILAGVGSGPFVTGESLTLADGAVLKALVDSTWNGPVQLDGSVIIDVPSAIELFSIGGLISGPGGFTKTGPGDLVLNGSVANTYLGETLVQGGDMVLANGANVPAIPGLLRIGGPAGGLKRVIAQADGQVVSNAVVWLELNGILDLQDHHAATARLLLDGGGTVAGGMLSRLTVNGPILCTNKFSPSSTISANLQLGAGATNLYVGTGNLTIEGQLSGPAGITWFKSGNGGLRLKGNSSFDGTIRPMNGTVYIDGSMPTTSWDVRAGAKMSGTGLVEVVTLNGGWLWLDAKANPLRMAQLLCPMDGILEVDVFGATSFGRGVCAMPPQLGTNVTTFPLIWINYDPPIGQSFVFLRNDSAQPVAGTFKDRPEGSIFESGPGRYFQLSYQGGDGNDVVLTRVMPPAPANLQGITKLQDGTMRVSATGTPGAWYGVEANENLSAPGGWQVIGHVLCPAGGSMIFDDDANSGAYPQRFYRFVRL